MCGIAGIVSLSGRPVFESELRAMCDAMIHRGPDGQGLHLGEAVPGAEAPFGADDFLMRTVLGADPGNGAIAVGAVIGPGTTVQFHVRDPVAADRQLRRSLATRHADGALLFACAQRGRALFGHANHDVDVIGDELGAPPLAGVFSVGEIGPAGGRNHLHSQTASLALFSDMNNM